jgi:hypothetical protein
VPKPRLRDVWPFSKPKTPGFGISEGFYLSVLAGTARLPSIVEVVEPKGQSGTVKGFGAPLTGGADKAKLVAPLERGAYAIASPDQKTVLQMLVLPKEEAGFDPEAFLNSALSIGLSDEMRNRIRSVWTLCQLTFKAHDPAVYPSLDFLLAIASRLGVLTEGVIADPLGQTYRLPERVPLPDSHRPVDARNFVTLATEEGYAFTLGMQKFALPEFEIEVPPGEEPLGGEFLLGLCQGVLVNGPIEPGVKVGSRQAPLQVAEGGLTPRWEGTACYEIIPAGNEVLEALKAWAAER